jgi:hypothetical protein
VVQALEDSKRILQAAEVTALSGVATVLVEAAETLSRTAKTLADSHLVEWMIAEQAAKHLGCESVEAFRKIAVREASPDTTYQRGLHDTKGVA